jgi:pyridoxine 4-dehydrogenase
MNDSISARSAGTVMIGDLQVNRLGFGAMRLTGEGIWGEPVDVEGCKQVLTSVFHR